MFECRIYKPTKTAMQAGRANTKKWILEFEPNETNRIDPLMGWVGCDNTNAQVKLYFNTKEEAINFANKKGLSHQVYNPKKTVTKSKSYSANFDYCFRFQ